MNLTFKDLNKKCPVSGHMRLQNRCGDAVYMYVYLFSCEVKKSFKTQCGRIPIDPAILAAIGRRFIATKNNQKPDIFWALPML